MKSLTRLLIAIATAAALLLGATGCANTALNNDNLAIAAGFKVITPTKPDQQAILAKLPKNQVSPVMYDGTRYFVIPDSLNNLAYVGGPVQYEAYQKLRVAKQLSNQNLEAAQMNEDANWGAWGGGVAFVGFRR
jgi:predicted dienelactone hydrolase